MDLLEYQAKELFREMGIPVLPSQRIDRPKDIKGLTIPYPVVLKSQVYIGGRGRVGGVKFVANTIDAIAAAQTIFNLSIRGEYPKVLLAEAKYNADREFYLAVVLNRSLRRPLLLGSQQGGMDVQSAGESMQYVIVDQEFSAYYARRLALKMGLQGELISAVSAIVEKMYHLFVQKDLDLVEINPLGISANGDVMALDGKISVNDEAIARHPDLAALLPTTLLPTADRPQDSRSAARSSHRPPIPLPLEPDGQISVLCNGTGLTLATLDLLCQAGGRPANVINIGSATDGHTSPLDLGDQLTQALDAILQAKRCRVLLINIVSGLTAWDDLADGVLACLNRYCRDGQNCALYGRVAQSEAAKPDTDQRKLPGPHLVIRIANGPIAAAPTLALAESRQEVDPRLDPRIHLVPDLDAAIAKAVSLSHVAPVPD